MPNTSSIFALILLLLSSACSNTKHHDVRAGCSYDKAKLLAMDEHEFDQTMNGWRALEQRKGCERVTADLLRDYRKNHDEGAKLLLWHEGQIRAAIGDTKAAIQLMDRARDPPDRHFGWNEYVDATLAFLRRDHRALFEARARLAALPKPPEYDAEVRQQEGAAKWPMNLVVVDALIKCFGRSYQYAYEVRRCRQP